MQIVWLLQRLYHHYIHRTLGARVILVVDKADDGVALCNNYWQGVSALHRVILVYAGIVLENKDRN